MLLFCLPALLLLASSFVKQPVPASSSLVDLGIKPAPPYGGVYLVFAGKYGGEITKQEMDSQTELKVEGCHKGAWISGFTLLITKNGQTSTLMGNSYVLTADMRSKLKSLAKGDQFEFRNAKAHLPNSKDVVDVRGSKFVVV